MIIPLGPLTIKIDVLVVQIINVFVLLWILKNLFGDMIIAEIGSRKELMKKLSNADGEYKAIVEEGQQEKAKLIEEGKLHKTHLMEEAVFVAKKTEEALITKAQESANSIVLSAENKLTVMEKNLMNEFESSVKQTAKMVVKKLIKSDKDIQSAYLDVLVKEVKSNS